MTTNDTGSETAMTDKAQYGYMAAITLWTYEGNQIWSKFTAMVYANTIIFTILGLVITSDKNFPVLQWGLPFIGMILCIAWFLLTKRGFEYYRHWILSARELEVGHLYPPVHTVSAGGDLSTAEYQLSRDLQAKKTPHSLCPYLRCATAKWVSYAVIGVFFLSHLLMLIAAFAQLPNSEIRCFN